MIAKQRELGRVPITMTGNMIGADYEPYFTGGFWQSVVQCKRVSAAGKHFSYPQAVAARQAVPHSISLWQPMTLQLQYPYCDSVIGCQEM